MIRLGRNALPMPALTLHAHFLVPLNMSINHHTVALDEMRSLRAKLSKTWVIHVTTVQTELAAKEGANMTWVWLRLYPMTATRNAVIHTG